MGRITILWFAEWTHENYQEGKTKSLNTIHSRAVRVLKNFLVFENHKYGLHLGVRIFSNFHLKKLEWSDLFGC